MEYKGGMMRVASMVVILAGLALLLWQGASVAAEDAAIHDGSKVAVDYVLIVDGNVVDSSQGRGPLEYTQGEGKLIPGFTTELEGMKAGDEKTFEVKPEDGYGNPDPAGIKKMPLSSVPEEIKPQVGMVLQMQDQEGQTFPARVVNMDQDSITIDLNHPLAGKALTFKVKVVSVQ